MQMQQWPARWRELVAFCAAHVFMIGQGGFNLAECRGATRPGGLATAHPATMPSAAISDGPRRRRSQAKLLCTGEVRTACNLRNHTRRHNSRRLQMSASVHLHPTVQIRRGTGHTHSRHTVQRSRDSLYNLYGRANRVAEASGRWTELTLRALEALASGEHRTAWITSLASRSPGQVVRKM